MATSGTVGKTVIDVTTLVEHSFRRCGKMASTISGELQQSARENLFFVLTDLANRGLSLFCVKKTVLNVVADRTIFDLPVGAWAAPWLADTSRLLVGSKWNGSVTVTAIVVVSALARLATRRWL